MKKGQFLILYLLFLVGGVLYAQDQRIGRIHLLIEEGSYQKAEEACDELIKVFKNGSEYYSELSDVGDLYFKLGKYSKYLTAKKSSFLLQKDKSDDYSLASINSMSDLSQAYKENGNYLLASRIQNREEEIRLTTFGSRSLQYAVSLARGANMLMVSGNLNAAATKMMSAYSIVEKKDNTIEKAEILNLYAELLTAEGRYTAAENYFRQASYILRRTDHNILKLANNLGMAELFLKLNNSSQAEKALQRAARFLNKDYSNQHPLRALYLSAKISLAIQVSDSLSISNYIKEIESIEVVDVYKGLTVNQSVAEGLLFLGRLSESNRLSELQFSIIEKLNPHHYLIAHLIDNRAAYYSKTGDYLKAVELLKQAKKVRRLTLDFEHPEYLNNLSALSLAYWGAGDIKNAKKYFGKSLYLSKIQYQKQFAFLSEYEKERFYSYIQAYFNKFNNFVLENYIEHPDLIELSINNQLLFKGLLFNSTKDLKRRVIADSKIFEKYKRYISAREKLHTAHKVIDRGLEISHINFDSLESTTNYLEKEISLRVKLGDSQEDLEQLYTTWEDVKGSLGFHEAAMEIIRINPYSIETDQINEEEVYYMFLFFANATKGSPEILIVRNGVNLDNRFLKYYRNALKFNVKDDISFNGYWRPLDEKFKLGRYNKIYIAPDGVYNLLSLNTLLDTTTDKYIVDKYELAIVGNLTDITPTAAFDQEKLKNNSSIFLGFPSYNVPLIEDQESIFNSRDNEGDFRGLYNDSGGINMLPGTLAEVESITSIFTDNKFGFIKLTGEAAREDTLKFKARQPISPRIVHVATHGFFLDPGENEEITDPLSLSGILLSGAAYSETESVLQEQLNSFTLNEIFDDGILYSHEAMNLNLFTTELVVLSACETGLGVVKNGEGVYGLQRAFQTAGASSVIMSLWKVDDEATQKFMTLFYEAWILSGDKRNAFITAQRSLRGINDHPYYWGAFVLIGS